MNGEELGEKLGRLEANTQHVIKAVEALAGKVEAHISGEEDRLKKIEGQLHLGRFVFLTIKAIVLTLAFLMAFKFGDIGALWKAIFK